MSELSLGKLPDLPQCQTLAEMAPIVWQEAGVVAMWVGGSLARGTGDAFSDIDFRVAVVPDLLPEWRSPPFERIFTRSPVVGILFASFGDDAMLHHLVLANGDIFDFFVQSTTREPSPEPVMILGCRSDEFATKLAARNAVPYVRTQPVAPEVVRQLLVDFWITTHKHRKVLHRGLDLMSPFGVRVEHSTLLRLWFIRVRAEDCGDLGRPSIHGLTEVARALIEADGPAALELIGMPMRNRAELRAAIEANRDVATRLGHCLAQHYGFEYPAALEATVLRSWSDFFGSGAR